MSNKRWWLISDDTQMVVRKALECARDRVDERCAETGCMCDLAGPRCSFYLEDALHELESGMHKSDAVPDDWKEEEK